MFVPNRSKALPASLEISLLSRPVERAVIFQSPQVCRGTGPPGGDKDGQARTITSTSSAHWESLVRARMEDREPQALRHHPASLRLHFVPHPSAPGTLWCDMSTATPPPFILAAFRLAVFQFLHDICNPRIRATRRLFTQRDVWLKINISK
ncbi:hypothetical protein HPB50_015005 [Hyalomma asiaticum]|uniref:Uncharacterized protein n=1 Tax=Hyalomma asiaticum TaxID=266040 RepID=A0ACB7SNL5_HYAAI|nr:hypothetical protein HPB50_015005 [Hyalomma asiaticum]